MTNNYTSLLSLWCSGDDLDTNGFSLGHDTLAQSLQGQA